MPACPTGSSREILHSDPCAATKEDFWALWNDRHIKFSQKLEWTIRYGACKFGITPPEATEVTVMEGCYISPTGEKVSIHPVYKEDGQFKHYSIHQVGSLPITTTNLTGYSACPELPVQPDSLPLCL